MSRLTDLLRAAKQLDPALGKDLEDEIVPLQKRLPFGLNFERHAPEAVELAGHAVRTGSKVRILPPRESKERGDQRLWRVRSVAGNAAQVSLLDAAEDDPLEVSVDDLILVAEFRERIYPGLRPDGVIESGKGKPFQTVINGENFHVLELLTFTHEHAVDAIYIDPPYNSGARDWKYNNDYVEGDDLYRHSKWLAFMERRLTLAKRLLNPDDSVLVVTIDEKEYLRLGLLLEQTFPEAKIQMVSIQINPANVARRGAFGRSDEYAFFVMMGDAAPQRLVLYADWVSTKGRTFTGSVRWDLLRRSGTNAQRSDRPNLFYPVYVDRETRAVVGAGKSPALNDDMRSIESPADVDVVWPIRQDGTHGNWQLGQSGLMQHVEQGRVRLGGSVESGYVVYYIKGGEYEKITRGDYPVLGRNLDGSLELGSSDSIVNLAIPGTQWRVPAHDSTQYGSRLLGNLLPGRSFPFPKSLYAVEDSLRFFVADKPAAIVLDFFAGSGTTAHAVMRLNAQDGGQRQCISVTNNEVSAEEQSILRQHGLRPGDPAWEKWGICDYITKPRIRAAITGTTPDGQPIKGDYKFSNEAPMADGFEENAAFFTLMYESPWRVSTDRAFSAIAPMLWLRAGAQGPRIEKIKGGWAVAETYGIINDLDQSAEFIAALNNSPDIRIAYIVTDDEGRYQQVADEIRGIDTVRLYEDYLRNCESTGDF